MDGWKLNPHSTYDWEIEEYVTDDGRHIAAIESVPGDSVSYPHAFDFEEKCWKRGGPRRDAVEAKQWAERVAGISPRIDGENLGVPHNPRAGQSPYETP